MNKTDKERLVNLFESIGVSYSWSEDMANNIYLKTHSDHNCYFKFDKNDKFVDTDIEHFDGY